MKKVISNMQDSNVVLVRDCDDRKLYILRPAGSTAYKAHKVEFKGRDKWAWIDMSSSGCWANGAYESLEDLLNSYIGRDEILEFDSYREMIKYLGDKL